MLLPPISDLHEICDLLGVGSFDHLSPDNKVKVLDLSLKANIHEELNAIANNTDDMAQWFKHSKLWDGI